MRQPHTATVQRMKQVGTKYVYENAGSIRCFLQPMTETSAQLFGMTWTKGAVVYTGLESDVKETDRLTINGKTYGVRGEAPRDYGSKRVQHRKLVVEKL